VLEHFSHNVRLQSALKEWHRVLQPGGVLRISVPDIDVLAHLLLQQNPKTGIREYRFSIVQRFQIMRMMFGGHMDEHDVHLVGLNEDFLRNFLQDAGFQRVDRVERHGLFKDTSDMIVAGTLISLNVEASRPARLLCRPNRLPKPVNDVMVLANTPRELKLVSFKIQASIRRQRGRLRRPADRVPESGSLLFGIRTLRKR
jgi:predicted SAM-dependent methyltransferase